eukprot:8834753-Karenia_brevis.AAC.1
MMTMMTVMTTMMMVMTTMMVVMTGAEKEKYYDCDDDVYDCKRSSCTKNTKKERRESSDFAAD